MNKLNCQNIVTLLRESTQEFISIAASLWRYLLQLSLPAALLFCLACALMLSILPLALTLFAGFLVFKLLAFIIAPHPSSEAKQK